MKQSFIYIATLALLFAACKKEDAASPYVPVTKYLQSSVSDAGDSAAILFTIDKSVDRMIWYREGKNFEITIPSYEPVSRSVVSVIVTRDMTAYRPDQRMVLTYNTMKQISTVSFYGADDVLQNIDSLSYSGTGKLDTIYYFRFNGETSQNELRKKFVQTWDAKNNIVKQEEMNVNQADGNTVTTYTYDDKNNPALTVAGYFNVNFQEDEVAGLLSANNILTSSTVNTTTGYTASARNTYQYDADNYPVAMTLRSMNQYTGQNPYTDSIRFKVYYGK